MIRPMQLEDKWRSLAASLQNNEHLSEATSRAAIRFSYQIPSINVLHQLINEVILQIFLAYGLEADDEPNEYGRWLDDKISECLHIICTLESDQSKSETGVV